MSTEDEAGGATGVLIVEVWPVYAGLAVSDPGEAMGACAGEPYYHPDYERGQITWQVLPDSGAITGRAHIRVPAGTYTFLTYHYGPGVWPDGPQLVGKRRLEFALHFPAAGTVDIDPINQGDWISP